EEFSGIDRIAARKQNLIRFVFIGRDDRRALGAYSIHGFLSMQRSHSLKSSLSLTQHPHAAWRRSTLNHPVFSLSSRGSKFLSAVVTKSSLPETGQVKRFTSVSLARGGRCPT